MTDADILVKNWNDVLSTLERFRRGQWIFRGANASGLPLKSSLEKIAVDRWGCDFAELADIEAGLITRFRREAERYLSHVPDPSDFIAWLAFMRHYGAPTRALDWTYSYYVALYFALTQAAPETECAVWATNSDWVKTAATRLLPEDARSRLRTDRNALEHETIRTIVQRTPPLALVYLLNPFHMNERLVIQQGVFLVPGDVTKSFMENLQALGPAADNVVEIRFFASREFMRDATLQLHRMNVNSATLFPGLDGFAQHLNSVIPFDVLRPP
jgi:hypothetical protein